MTNTVPNTEELQSTYMEEDRSFVTIHNQDSAIATEIYGAPRRHRTLAAYYYQACHKHLSDTE